MKTLLSALLACGLLFAQLLFAGCCASVEAVPGQLAFTPEGEAARAAFDAAAARLEAATGVRPYVAPAGTPIRLDAETEGNCADTTADLRDGVVQDTLIDIHALRERCFPDAASTLAHEIIHVARLRVGLDVYDENQGHSSDGLFRAKAGDDRLEASTLNAFCEAVDCITYNPES